MEHGEFVKREDILSHFVGMKNGQGEPATFEEDLVGAINIM